MFVLFRSLVTSVLTLAVAAVATAHDGPHPTGPQLDAPLIHVNAQASQPADATTGSGDLKFRYRADLSELPAEIAKGIKPAHGGFAKTPSGDIYFGLQGTGLIKISPDLTEISLVSSAGDLLGGGLHNTTYVDRDGGILVLPDNARGQVLAVGLDGSPIGKLGRPTVNEYYSATGENGAPKNGYAPTDTEVVGDTLYVCDGYSAGKYVLTADLGAMRYKDAYFGGRVGGSGREEGKFSTNHGVTLDAADDTLVIADRERQWAQRMSPEGEFIEGFDMAGANPCDVDFVEHEGEKLMVAGCLVGPDGTPGVVQLLRDGRVVSTLKPKLDLGIEAFQHIHNAAGVVVDGKLFVLCYGWNPGCYAVLEHTGE